MAEPEYPDRTDRIAPARQRHEASIKAEFAAAGIAYPPQALFMRVFKREARLELWAKGNEDAFRLIRNYPVTKSSGTPGPKRREGDLQVPEGFYEVEKFNPKSNFHLSLGLNYPNLSDLVRSDPDQPGSDIYIHGGAVSVGCVPLGDDNIEEVFLAAWDFREHSANKIEVHIFPAEMHGPAWTELVHEHKDLLDFWSELRPGYEAFEKSHVPPRIGVDANGHYTVIAAKP